MSTMDTTNTNENEMIKVSDDEAINAKFNAKLQDLLSIAHSKKNVIEDTELIKHFNDLKEVALDLDTMQKIFNFLEQNGVDILQITDTDEEEPALDEDVIAEGRRLRRSTSPIQGIFQVLPRIPSKCISRISVRYHC